METKSIFTSKTFWANAVGLAAMIAQGYTGKEIMPLETQGAALSIVNILLRAITKQPVNWK